jgi:CRISPR-associated protein Cas2
MWLLAMFDLPMKTSEARRAYGRFRKQLLSAGFVGLQRSVYARHADTEAAAEVQAARLHRSLPPAGDVRLLTLSDRQFARMRVYRGSQQAAIEEPPGQLQMF